MENLETKTLAFGVNDIRMKAIFERSLLTPQDSAEDISYHSIHAHVNYEVFFIINGHIEISTEGGNRIFRSSVLLLPPKFRHFTSFHGEILPFFISFSKQNDASRISLIESSLNNGEINEMPLTADLLFCLSGLSSSLRSHSECSDQRSVSYLELIFSDIFEHFGIFGISKAERDKEYAYFSVIELFINRHYADGYGLNELADKLHLSVRQASRVVNKLYGESFTSIIHNKRLSIASVLLKNTDKPISVISDEIGFSNESSFFTNFKKKYSLTPLKYRKLHKK